MHETVATLFQFKVFNPTCCEDRIRAGSFLIQDSEVQSALNSCLFPAASPGIGSAPVQTVLGCSSGGDGTARERTWSNIPHTHGLVLVLHLLILGSLPIPSPCPQTLIHPSPFSFPSFSDYAASSQASLILQKPQKGAGVFFLFPSQCTPADGSLCTAVAWSQSQPLLEFRGKFPLS